MPQPVYFTVTADYKAFVEDADTDSDYTPEQVPVSATVTFTPLVNTGDVVRALGASPRPVGYIPAPVTAIIDTADGRLKLRTTPDSGGSGDFAPVRLLGTSDLLDLDGPLFYSVSFSNVVYANGRRGTIAGFTFEAPDTDTEVNLISVGRAAGQAASNLVRPTVAVGTTTTGDPGTDAEVTNSGTSTSAVFDFTIPRGDQGEAATVTVGTVSTGNAGSSATVTNSGTSTDAILDFTIPRGDTGDAATVTVGTVTTGNAGSSASVTNSGTSGAAVLDFSIPRGDTGTAATVAVGTVSTGAAGSSATVTNSGTSGAAVLNFTIPQGVAGSATINGITATELGRLVCTTQQGDDTATPTGANTWAKILTWSPGTTANIDMALILGIATHFTANGHDTAIISVYFRQNPSGSGTPTIADVQIIGKAGTGTQLAADSFKVLTNGFGGNYELWVRKNRGYGQFGIYELSRGGNTTSLTYTSNPGWQQTTPSGSAVNVSTNGVTAFGVPVLTTTGTATVTNKDLTSATNSFPTSLVTLTGSQSLSNKTIVSPTLSTPTVSGSTATAASITASGTDTNIDLSLSGKGSGGVVLTGTTQVSTGGAVELYNVGSGGAANFERGAIRYNSNILEVGHFYGGTSSSRSACFGVSTAAGSTSLARYIKVAPGAPFISFEWGGTGNTGNLVAIGPSSAITASSSVQSVFAVNPTINQSGTASYTALLINPTETATGSGTKRLIDAQVGGVSRFTVDNAGNVSASGTVQSNGVEVATVSGTQTLSNKRLASATVPATATSTGTTGQIAYDNDYVYICTATNTWRRAALSTW